MPPASGRPNGGLPGGSTTIAIILILVIPSLLLLALCLTRKTPLFEAIRRHAPQVPQRLKKRPPVVAGAQSLELMPVVKYDHQLFATAEEGLEVGCCKDDVISGSAEDNSNRQTSPLRNISTWIRRWDLWSFLRIKGSNVKDSLKHKQHPSQDSLDMASSHIHARKLAMQTCAICTEDFRHGVDVRKLPCGHIFHPHCIDPWLLDFAATCPLCRIDLRAKEAEESVPEPPRAVVPPAAQARSLGE